MFGRQLLIEIDGVPLPYQSDVTGRISREGHQEAGAIVDVISSASRIARAWSYGRAEDVGFMT